MTRDTGEQISPYRVTPPKIRTQYLVHTNLEPCAYTCQILENMSYVTDYPFSAYFNFFPS
jgi:hypothetical protein